MQSVSTPTVRADVDQRGHEDEITRRGTKHDIAGVQERIGHEVQELVAAGGDHDLIQLRRRVVARRSIRRGHAGNNRLAQGHVADCGAILQCGPSTRGVRPQRGEGPLHSLDRQGNLIDETGGQRDQIGPRQGLGHQATDQLVAPRPMGTMAQTELFTFCHISSNALGWQSR